jgi:hypothetical protein
MVRVYQWDITVSFYLIVLAIPYQRLMTQYERSCLPVLLCVLAQRVHACVRSSDARVATLRLCACLPLGYINAV